MTAIFLSGLSAGRKSEERLSREESGGEMGPRGPGSTPLAGDPKGKATLKFKLFKKLTYQT